MLAAIGSRTMEELFADIPQEHRFPHFDLPEPLSEPEMLRHMREMAARNFVPPPENCFLGAGCYRHYIPPTVDYVLQRGEFYTSYTPYQPELSQGMLQAMFEYQTMVCRLTDMDVANASHYCGATSLAEACLMAVEIARPRRDKIVLSPALHPHYRAVVETYATGQACTPVTGKDGEQDIHGLLSRVGEDTAAVVVQNPNFFGQFEALEGFAEKVHARGALLIVVTDPISLGLFKSPGDYDADVAVMDGQSLGIPPSFGGPHLGIFATRTPYLRRMAGRLVGQTVDREGKRGYVLTLATREQHIRRARAVSNICTNAALGALAASAYLATLGSDGLATVARLCHDKAHYAAGELGKIPGIEVNSQAPDKPFFKEFTVKLPRTAAETGELLLERYGIIGGYDLEPDFPHLKNTMLLAFTELHTRQAIDSLAAALKDICR